MSIVVTVISLVLLILGPIGTVSIGFTASPLPEPRPLGRGIRSVRPGDLDNTSERLPVIEVSSGIITLSQVLALALIKNPELAAVSWEVRARDAAMLQAGLLPNPEVSLEIEEIGGSAFNGIDQAETTLSVGQRIQLSGKRQKRKNIASLTHDLAGWDYETMRLDIFTKTSLRFIAVLGEQKHVALNEDLVKLARQVADTVSQRVAAGKVSPVEEIKANVSLSSAEIELGRARRKLTASRKKLAAMWGSAIPEFQSVAGKLVLAETLPSFEELAARLSQNPELDRWQAELRHRRAVIELEKAKAIPDITLGGGIRQFNETDTSAFVAGISIDLPVFDRNQGTIRAARAEYSKGLLEQKNTELRLKAVLAEAYRALSTSHGEALTLQAKLIPGAEKAFKAVSEGYRLGKFDLLNVLDAQRTLSRAKAQYLSAQIDYQQALTEVERLIGEKLEGGTENPPPIQR